MDVCDASCELPLTVYTNLYMPNKATMRVSKTYDVFTGLERIHGLLEIQKSVRHGR